MNFVTDDIDAMLADEFGLATVSGAHETRCFEDSADEILLDRGSPSQTIGTTISVLIRSGSLGSAAAGQQIKIENVPYVIRESYKLDDGKLTRLLCAVA